MEDIIDFAVVGGGVAGAYVAWRIAMSPPDELQQILGKQSSDIDIRLYERTGRTGGRLLSAVIPGMPFSAELGGMRYTSKQVLVDKLIERKFQNHKSQMLRLTPRSFDFGKHPLFYLRGIRFHSEDDAPYQLKSTPPYRLGHKEIGKAPAQLIILAIRAALIELKFSGEMANGEVAEIGRILNKLRSDSLELKDITFSARQWATIKRRGMLQGRQLYDIGFWNLVWHYLSSEAFLFARDGLGYESILANWNAAEAIPWFLKDFHAKYSTLAAMQQIPRVLIAEFASLYPDSVYRYHVLKSVHQELRDNRQLLRLTFRTGDKDTTILARHAILALPQGPLKKIEFKVPGLKEVEWRRSLNSVTGRTLFKLFLGYERQWWHDGRGLGRPSGRAVTDMPIRQVYYYGADKAVEGTYGTDPENMPGMIMASYSDEQYADFWSYGQTLAGETLQKYYYTGNEPNERERIFLRLYGVPASIVNKAQRQLKQLHPELEKCDCIPEPYAALAKKWVPGWHCWNPQIRPWDVMATLKRPFDANVYICGEAFSCEQGWVEGALRSAELVLREINISPPTWVEDVDYKNVGCNGGYAEYIEWPTAFAV